MFSHWETIMGVKQKQTKDIWRQMSWRNKGIHKRLFCNLILKKNTTAQILCKNKKLNCKYYIPIKWYTNKNYLTLSSGPLWPRLSSLGKSLWGSCLSPHSRLSGTKNSSLSQFSLRLGLSWGGPASYLPPLTEQERKIIQTFKQHIPLKYHNDVLGTWPWLNIGFNWKKKQH